MTTRDDLHKACRALSLPISGIYPTSIRTHPSRARPGTWSAEDINPTSGAVYYWASGPTEEAALDALRLRLAEAVRAHVKFARERIATLEAEIAALEATLAATG